jgi:hypothetical protein
LAVTAAAGARLTADKPLQHFESGASFALQAILLVRPMRAQFELENWLQ